MDKLPEEITKEELTTRYEDFLTVGKLKQFLATHNLPDDAKVVIERVEDFYYDENHWGVYLKKGDAWWQNNKWNEDVESGKYLDKDQYPNIKPENLKLIGEEELKNSMTQYHPAWSCVRYHDDLDVLFIDLHY